MQEGHAHGLHGTCAAIVLASSAPECFVVEFVMGSFRATDTHNCLKDATTIGFRVMATATLHTIAVRARVGTTTKQLRALAAARSI